MSITLYPTQLIKNSLLKTQNIILHFDYEIHPS